MSLSITLIRHGQTQGNLEKRYVGRTDEGLLASERDRLLTLSPILPDAQKLYVSPLIRCRETASCLYGDQEQIILDDLRECDFGSFEYKNYLELAGDADYQAWIDSNGTLPFPGGESMESFRQRCCGAFREAIRGCRNDGIESAAFVVHGGTIMSILSTYARPERSYYDWQVGNGEGFVLSLAPSADLILTLVKTIGKKD